MTDERWLTVEDVAQIAQVHEQSVRRWLRAGTLKGHLINRRAGYRVRESDLRAFLSGESEGSRDEETSGPNESDR